MILKPFKMRVGAGEKQPESSCPLPAAGVGPLNTRRGGTWRWHRSCRCTAKPTAVLSLPQAKNDGVDVQRQGLFNKLTGRMFVPFAVRSTSA